jgi:drug/metabolite transporter (DMT)-like permease
LIWKGGPTQLLSLIVRVFLLIVGVISCTIGTSATRKLFRETLDSPRWMIAGLALIAFAAGAAAILLAAQRRRW